MKKDFLKYGNLVAFVAVLVFNVLATLGVLGGVTTKEVSGMYQSLLTPAGYAFSIWSLIYILLGFFVYRQFKDINFRDNIGYWFILSCVLNVLWILAWQFKAIAVSFVLILLLLFNLIVLMYLTKDEKLLANLAIGLYTGWINVAMLANLGALFSRYNWVVFSLKPQILAIIGLIFGLLWISFFIYRFYNMYYALGAVWGYLGIILAAEVSGILMVASSSVVIFIAVAIWSVNRKINIDYMKNY